MEERDSGIDQVEARLRAERFDPDELQIDALKRRVLADKGTRSKTGSFMRSRLAIVSMIVLGFGLSGSGGALAVSGISANTDASTAQYGGNGGNNNGNGPNCAKGKKTGNKHCNNTLGTTTGGGNQGTNVNGSTGDGSQAGDQVSASGSNGGLPFTGLAALPLLLVGLALLGTGVMLGRRARSGPS